VRRGFAALTSAPASTVDNHDHGSDPERPTIREHGAEHERARCRRDQLRPHGVATGEPLTEEQHPERDQERRRHEVVGSHSGYARDQDDERDARLAIAASESEQHDRGAERADHQRGPERPVGHHVLEVVHAS